MASEFRIKLYPLKQKLAVSINHTSTLPDYMKTGKSSFKSLKETISIN